MSEKVNPAVMLNGDQVYLDELIRENARLTVMQEAFRVWMKKKTGRTGKADHAEKFQKTV